MSSVEQQPRSAAERACHAKASMECSGAAAAFDHSKKPREDPFELSKSSDERLKWRPGRKDSMIRGPWLESEFSRLLLLLGHVWAEAF